VVIEITELAWPHLQLVYDVLRNWLAKRAKNVDEPTLMLTLSRNCGAGDPRERTRSKEVLTLLWGSTSFAGRERFAAGLGGRLRGLASSEFLSFVYDIVRDVPEGAFPAILRLHCSRRFESFDSRLGALVVRFLREHPTALTDALEFFRRWWPTAGSGKKQIYIVNEIDKLLGLREMALDGGSARLLFQNLSKLITSEAAKAAEAALMLSV
jgi:hypothetical protein